MHTGHTPAAYAARWFIDFFEITFLGSCAREAVTGCVRSIEFIDLIVLMNTQPIQIDFRQAARFGFLLLAQKQTWHSRQSSPLLGG